MAVTRVRPGTSANPPRTSQAQPGGVPKGVASVTTPKPSVGPTKVGQVGTPGGKPPAKPTAGQSYTGPGGVNWKYDIAKGGWVRVPVAPGTVTAQSRPSATSIPAPTTPTAPAATPVAAPSAAATPFNYANAFYADPRYAAGVAGITQTQLDIGTKYGLTLNRDTNPSSPTYGMVKYRVPGSTAATGDITAKVDPVTGDMTYLDSTGKAYDVRNLELDYIPISRGQAGYLEGQFGQTQAGSEKRQFEIGDVAARTVGARQSGMRAQAGLDEARALQNALRNLTFGSAGEQFATTQQYANLLNTIYPDLVKSAEAYAASTAPVPTPEAPAAPETSSAPAGAPSMPGVPQRPLPAPRTISIAGQDVSFPKGINLAGVDVRGIGQRIAGNVAAVGGVSKLKPGQKVGEFRATTNTVVGYTKSMPPKPVYKEQGYRVFYRGGKFVIEAIG